MNVREAHDLMLTAEQAIDAHVAGGEKDPTLFNTLMEAYVLAERVYLDLLSDELREKRKPSTSPPQLPTQI